MKLTIRAVTVLVVLCCATACTTAVPTASPGDERSHGLGSTAATNQVSDDTLSYSGVGTLGSGN